MSGSEARAMRALVERLYPLCRSLTGDGVRETLDVIAERIPLERHQVASGTEVGDWTVPREWNVDEAWVADVDGRRVVDFREHNLHLVGYSRPIRERVTLETLRAHCHSLPEHPDWIPYRTSYYDEDWGFCLRHRDLEALSDPEYDVVIDSRLEDGELCYGELELPGTSGREYVFSVHVCHPSLANDNLSGIAVAVELARWLGARERRNGYRLLFIPGTIGSITWLARNRERLAGLAGGMSLVCLGDPRALQYKRSLPGDRPIDRAAAHVVERRGGHVIDFMPYGYDERQFSSPGARIPYGSLMRGQHGRFPEYHTSADDLDFIRDDQLVDALEALRELVGILEQNRRVKSLVPFGEPQLGRRGLYRTLGGEADPAEASMAMLWLLALATGEHDLLAIAERAGLAFDVVARAADRLRDHGLIEDLPEESASG